MTTNETKSIAEWLKLEIFEESKYLYKVERYDTHELFAKTKKLIKLDFLHDRNQQKWIEDELEKRGYSVLRSIDRCDAWVRIIYENLLEKYIDISKENEIPDLDQAFIEAVLELINEENATNQNVHK